MKKTILFRRLRNFVYAMMLPGMAMFIGSFQMNQIGNGCLTDNGMMSRYVRK